MVCNICLSRYSRLGEELVTVGVKRAVSVVCHRQSPGSIVCF
jgi:hypothetical protein